MKKKDKKIKKVKILTKSGMKNVKGGVHLLPVTIKVNLLEDVN